MNNEIAERGKDNVAHLIQSKIPEEVQNMNGRAHFLDNHYTLVLKVVRIERGVSGGKFFGNV